MQSLIKVMDAVSDFFPSDFAAARARFLDSCTRSGAALTAYRHPLKGPDGAALVTDVARLGPANASKQLIVISGTHGVEGLAGSGCQVAWLELDMYASLPSDTAVLLIHLLNPWGCAWQRRQTEDNIDLNRNFQPFDAELPMNQLYEQIHAIIVDSSHAGPAAADPLLTDFRRQRGDDALATALFSGQYRHSDGVGFGGREPSWSNLTLRQILQTHALRARRTTVIDIHTGIGPYGYGTVLCTDSLGSAALQRARAHYGPGLVALSADATWPYQVEGDLLSWIRKTLDSEVTGIALEFGTFELARLLELQVDDCRSSNSGRATIDSGVRAELRDFFFPASLDWLQSVVLRALQVIHLSIIGLQGPAQR